MPAGAKTFLAEVPGGQTSFDDSINSGENVYYEVTAINGEGAEGPASNEANTAGPPGPIAHWTFYDGSGTVAADSSGNGFDGTLVSGPTWSASGRIGGALSFDGNNDRVDLPPQAMDGLSDLTISFWIRTTNRRAQGFISGANAGNSNEFLLFQRHRYRINYHTGESAGTYVSCSLSNLANKAWHHILMVRDASAGKVTIYVDGASKGTRSTALSPLQIDANGLLLGQDQDSVGEASTPGKPSRA